MENIMSKNGASSCSSDCDLPVIGDIITKEMIDEERALEANAVQEEMKIKERIAKEEKDREEEQCYTRLNELLSRSSLYAQFMADKIKRDKVKEEKKQIRIEKKKGKRQSEITKLPRKKRSLITHAESEDDDKNAENENISDNFAEIKKDIPEGQPSTVTGGVMHPYQIAGFNWLKNLFENGANGILADEMGLGKTIQTIAFVAHLIEMGISGPFFICAPLSTVANWYSEFKRFAPNIPVLVYHGNKDDRNLMRPKFMKKVRQGSVFCCPVIITSYQIPLIDSKFLLRYDWKLMVIDEAHRIKNFQCKLVTSLKKYHSSHRLLLTGTPLQNDLCELWSLLNFILPDIFDDLKVFESWFDVSRLVQKGGTDEIIAKEQEKHIVSIIHQILTPFLLRRTKSEVALKLPPKKEVIVYAPLTKLQQEYYTAVLNRTIEQELGKTTGQYFDVKVDINSGRPNRNKCVDFSKIYKLLEDNESEESDDIQVPDAVKSCIPVTSSTESRYNEILADIKVNIRNISMILRKICNHPYLLSYPLNPSGEYRIDEDLIKTSGKLLVLDIMLPELKKRGHKVLLFSQFVSMLDVLEDYCIYRNYAYSFLCGDMSLDEREVEMKKFKTSEDSFIFLISTRAGGLGINLAQADTVIIFDSDWNPQSDLQAQDRCHRIGQNKPVVVYRFMIPNTVDQTIIDRANAKRKLEKVIMKRGRFNFQGGQNEAKLSIKELLELLHASDISGFVKTDDNCVLTPEELQRLLDRSDMIGST